VLRNAAASWTSGADARPRDHGARRRIDLPGSHHLVHRRPGEDRDVEGLATRDALLEHVGDVVADDQRVPGGRLELRSEDLHHLGHTVGAQDGDLGRLRHAAEQQRRQYRRHG
jgi:hypothetical protein